MRTVYSKIVRLAVLGIFIFFAFLILKQFSVAYQNNSHLKSLEKSISELSQENETIKQETALSDDPDTIDREARTRLNLKKEGEHVVIILPSDNESFQDELASTDAEPASVSVWKKIMSWLGVSD